MPLLILPHILYGSLSENSVLDNNIKIVSVLDVNNRHISFTSSARARILVKKGKAFIFGVEPYIIKLNGKQRVKDRKVKEMQRKEKSIKNFTEYFRDERDVYVQNKTNTQISLEFGMTPNISSVTIPKTKKPFNLSQHVPFKDLKNSVNLRKMLNRRPPVMDLMEEKEYIGFYEDLAKENNTDIDEEINRANEEQMRLMNRQFQMEDAKREDEKAEAEAEDIEIPPQPKPFIVGLCVDNTKTASEILDDLKMMEDELTVADLEYLQNKIELKTVKKWVVKKISSLQDQD